MTPSETLAQFGLINTKTEQKAAMCVRSNLGNNRTIDDSQKQSMKMAHVKRVRFNLESNQTIYFSKDARIKVGLTKNSAIRGNLCRWGDIAPTTVSRLSFGVPPRLPSKPPPHSLPSKYDADKMLSTGKEENLSTPRRPKRRSSMEMTLMADSVNHEQSTLKHREDSLWGPLSVLTRSMPGMLPPWKP
jgi:hypothetical protein